MFITPIPPKRGQLVIGPERPIILCEIMFRNFVARETTGRTEYELVTKNMVIKYNSRL